MTTIELNDHEVMALMLLLKLGMDMYTGNDTEAAMEGLHGVPYYAIDSVILKVSDAGEEAADQQPEPIEGNA